MENVDKLLTWFAANPRVFALTFVLTCIGAWQPLAALYRLISRTLRGFWHQSFVGPVDAWIDRIKRDARKDLNDSQAQQSRVLEAIQGSILPAINILLFIPLGMAMVIFESKEQLGDFAVTIIGLIFVNLGMFNVLLLVVEHGEHLLYRRFVKEMELKQ